MEIYGNGLPVPGGTKTLSLRSSHQLIPIPKPTDDLSHSAPAGMKTQGFRKNSPPGLVGIR